MPSCNEASRGVNSAPRVDGFRDFLPGIAAIVPPLSVVDQYRASAAGTGIMIDNRIYETIQSVFHIRIVR